MEEVKKDLKLFQELKDEAYLNDDNSLQSLKNKNNIYDIDPKINYNLLNKLLENNNSDFIINYFNLIQTLTLKQKIELNKRLKNYPSLENKIKESIEINNKSYIDQYFSV